MNIEFSALKARILGSLIEKEITTPDQYPLSLNSLTNACNQKTNRDPVLELAESAVQGALDALMRRHLVTDKSAGYGGRVTKYKHRLCNSEFGALKFTPQELGLVCVLLLRGPQTPGELRARTQRLCEFADTAELEGALEGLMTRPDGPFVTRLARQPGARESRYAHLFCGPVAQEAEPAGAEVAADPAAPPLAQRLARLEEALEHLRARVEVLEGR